MNRDERIFQDYSEKYLIEEQHRLQRLIADASSGLGSIKTELLHRAIEKAALKESPHGE